MDFGSFILAVVLGAIIGVGFFYFSNSSATATTATTNNNNNTNKSSSSASEKEEKPRTDVSQQAPGAAPSIPEVTVLYATQRNASKNVAKEIVEGIAPKLRPFRVSEPAIDIKTLNNVEELKNHKRLIFVLPTYEGGTPPPSAKQFAADLLDLVQDFRVSRDFFSRQKIAIMGLGDAQYAKQNFCKFAKDVTHYFITLGAERLIPTMCVDEPYVQTSTVTFIHKTVAAIQRGSTVEEEKKSKEKYLDEKKFKEAQDERDAAAEKENNNKGECCGGGCCQNDDDNQQQEQQVANGKKKRSSNRKRQQQQKQQQQQSSGISAEEIDKKNAKVDDSDEEEAKKDDNNDEEEDMSSGSDTDDEGDIEEIIAAPRKQMLYPRLRRNLEKEGYGLIGSHSGVKLCRWTKSMLRGRGGCYKHTFYNISSFQCMEMTPSLACANKCVFCWRHHTNPVARTFQWEHDPPQFLVEGGIARHQNMIRAMRGVPGVIPARLEEAMSVKHCALSLVGEPIMYPEINKFLTLLHERHISSFLVTNAQFPEQMENLVPCTQLYVSVDASTPEDLKSIDRPLFEDYWERMMTCIKELARKPYRTVFRLTLVNQYNMENLKEYTDLIRLGNPHFVEVKGVTFCGAGSASDLTIQNSPYHNEVVKFCKGLCDLLPGYEIACEHEHSCCMLIAKKTFKVDGKWHTWIDYKKFFELCESGRTDFTAMEYAMETPEWAVFDSKEHGFDPQEVRHNRGKPITGAGC